MSKIAIDFDNIHLVYPCAMYINSYRAAIAEYKRHNIIDFAYPNVRSRREVASFLQQIDNSRRGINIRSGYVPTSAFWLVDGQNYIGSGDVRHFLNTRLQSFGGNIGYSIRPSAWRQGLGTLQLSLLLKEAAKLHISKPIITCFDDNTSSAKVIEKNGGVLIRKVINTCNNQTKLTRIYEIDLTRKMGCVML